MTRKVFKMNEITIADCGESLTITLTGEAVANLRKAAEVMNGLKWCDNDNTAESILSGFALFNLESWGESTTHYKGLYLCDQLDIIADAIDTLAADDDEDKERREELRSALYRAFDIRNIAELKGANDGTRA